MHKPPIEPDSRVRADAGVYPSVHQAERTSRNRFSHFRDAHATQEEHVRIEEAIADIGLGLIGGYVGTKLMEPVSMKLYKLESEEDRRREDSVRPGSPYEIAARKTTRSMGLELEQKQLETLATYGFHYGLGMSWGTVYTLLRRLSGLHPVAAGLLTGAALSLLVDEGLTPALGFSAPNSAYPAATHVRGFVAHLVYGLGIAATAEVLSWLGGHAYRAR